MILGRFLIQLGMSRNVLLKFDKTKHVRIQSESKNAPIEFQLGI